MTPAGEGAQVEAWEADFLNDLYQVRQLKAEMTMAVNKVGPTFHFHDCHQCKV